jgi:hypothetical protein
MSIKQMGHAGLFFLKFLQGLGDALLAERPSAALQIVRTIRW